MLTSGNNLNLNPGVSGSMTITVNSPANNLVAGTPYVFTIAQVSGGGVIELNGAPISQGTVLPPSEFQIVSNFSAASNFTTTLQTDSATGQSLQLVYTPTSAVPEPSQILLLGVLGLGGVGGWMRRRLRRKPA